MTNTAHGSDAAVDILGVGNAIVDVVARADETFLAEQDIPKGGMLLIDAARSDTLYDAMGPGTESSGGSAANTIAGAASFGAQTAFIGKVKNDQLGKVFAHDLKAIGVAFDTPPAEDGPATARCLVNVTPDAQRSMCTYLGACVELGPDDIDETAVAAAGVTYLEGYLFDPPQAKAAFRKAAEIARAAGRKVSMTLSDSFCVERHRADFLAFIHEHVDILFANETEVKALVETSDFDSAAEELRRYCAIAALTRSEKGSVILTGEGETVRIDAVAPRQLVDTTGAGDQYAGGFLAGYAAGRPLAHFGALGALAASEVISHYGARPETSLKDLAAENGL
ncbi:MAG: adenosine kinase [Pseudomonadota bacterium]